MSEPAEPPSETAPAPRSRLRRAIGLIASVAIIVGLLVGVLPAMADFGEVWGAIRSLTWLEATTLLIAAVWNILTYQFVILAALPGLTLLRAFVVGQISTAVANTLPAGSAVGVGVTYTMFSSFGFSAGSIAIASVVTGLWNTFVKLGLPVIALAILTIGGGSNPALQSAAVTGVAILAGAIVLLALVLSSDSVARIAGERLGSVVSRMARPFKRGPFDDWGEGFARFRARWVAITVASLVSHLSLFGLLLLSLRHMGVPSTAVSGPEALAAFALVRLVTAVPITPGNLGIVEVGMAAALVLAGGEESLVVAAVLVYRALSYVFQVPLGLIAYGIWKSKTSWRAAPPNAPA
jgi:uncharacterized protein (TIRG00374 family)